MRFLGGICVLAFGSSNVSLDHVSLSPFGRNLLVSVWGRVLRLGMVLILASSCAFFARLCYLD